MTIQGPMHGGIVGGEALTENYENNQANDFKNWDKTELLNVTREGVNCTTTTVPAKPNFVIIVGNPPSKQT